MRYEADRGRTGRPVPDAVVPVGGPWNDGLRLILGEDEEDEAGDLCEGGVYGIPTYWCGGKVFVVLRFACKLLKNRGSSLASNL